MAPSRRPAPKRPAPTKKPAPKPAAAPRKTAMNHDDYKAPVHTPHKSGETKDNKDAEKEPSAFPEGYVPQPFPKMKFHKDGRTRTVANELDEDTAEAEGFTLDKPAEKKDDDEKDEKDEKKKKAD
jgi:hypothetical protein